MAGLAMADMSRTNGPLKGAGALLLYLDFDGVLHHENVIWHPRKGATLLAPPRYRLFQHVPLLEELMAPYPEVQIVLSTAWVRYYSYSGTAKKLPVPLRARVIGSTFHSEMNSTQFEQIPRGMQVCSDVARRKPRGWLALDDDYYCWPISCLEQYVRTDAYDGISAPTVTLEIRQKLEKLCAT